MPVSGYRMNKIDIKSRSAPFDYHVDYHAAQWILDAKVSVYANIGLIIIE